LWQSDEHFQIGTQANDRKALPPQLNIPLAITPAAHLPSISIPTTFRTASRTFSSSINAEGKCKGYTTQGR
jgi:hypothetical protein